MNQSSSGDQRIDFIGPVRNMQMCTTQCDRSIHRQNPGIKSGYYMALEPGS